MIRIFVNGVQGQMGRAIERALVAKPDTAILVGGVDPDTSSRNFPVYPSWDLVDAEFDAVIDFSVPSAAMETLKHCVASKKPIVIATTGLSPEQQEQIIEASRTIPIFCTGNMSLGINLMRSLCKQAAQMLGEDFDVEIIEKHHNRKIDAPSGTALMLADAVSSAREEKPHYVYGRESKTERRGPKEIGIHSVRGGTIVGEHEVWFMGEDEAVVLRHQAFSKRVFATGAIRAAEFLRTKANGLYSMDDLVAELL